MKILHLEDHRREAELVGDLLRNEWPRCAIDLVATRDAFVAALATQAHDVILSDYKLPGFSGREALVLARAQAPEVPFVFLSGTVGEETAVEIVREGAADYILKDRMQRLPLAIRRALRDKADRENHRRDVERIREQAELLDQARDGIVVTALDNRIVFWNRGAELMLGWTAAEALGQLSYEHVGPAIAAEIKAMHRKVEAADAWRGELRLQHKDGRPVIADVSVSLIRDSAGRPRSRLKILTDITEKKNLEEQYLRAQRLECLGMLAAGIAHDLNNALAPILMAGQLLRVRATDPRDIAVLDILERSAGRGAALVKQIVAFAGGAGQEKAPVQTKHLLRDILDLAQETFPKSIEVEAEVANDLWPVLGNPSQLHQILLNFCINARDAMPSGGKLTLRAANRTLGEREAAAIPDATAGDFLLLEVADTGTGIPPDVLARIWEPFFTTKGEGKGTGLGLATVRGIVAGHGGFVTVASTVGLGSVFSVYLPAAGERPGSDEGAGAAAAAPGRGELVFVVDDEASIRESVGAILRLQGYRTLTLGDGIEALAEYAKRVDEAALVITDLEMPKLDGRTLAQAMLGLNPAAKLVIMSGAGGGEAVAKTLPGALFLPKPFSAEALLGAVHAALHRAPPAAP